MPARMSSLSFPRWPPIKLFLRIPYRTFSNFRRQRCFGYITFDQLLNTIKLKHVLLIHERQCDAGRFGTRCSPHAMNIVFGILRNIVIDNQVDVLDVDATADDIGSYEYSRFTRAEAGQYFFTFTLFKVR